MDGDFLLLKNSQHDPKDGTINTGLMCRDRMSLPQSTITKVQIEDMMNNAMILATLGVVVGFGYQQYYVEPLYGQWQQTLQSDQAITPTILDIQQHQLKVQQGQQQHAYDYQKLSVTGDCTQLHVGQQVQDFCVYGNQLVVRSLEPERIERYERVS
jgi:hypothetical protein